MSNSSFTITQPDTDRAITDSLDLQDEEEITLTTPANLASFMACAEQVVAAAMQYRAVAEADQYAKLEAASVQGEKVFSALTHDQRELAARVAEGQDVLEQGRELSDAAVAELQRLYDRLLHACDLIETAYRTVLSAEVPAHDVREGKNSCSPTLDVSQSETAADVCAIEDLINPTRRQCKQISVRGEDADERQLQIEIRCAAPVSQVAKTASCEVVSTSAGAAHPKQKPLPPAKPIHTSEPVPVRTVAAAAKERRADAAKASWVMQYVSDPAAVRFIEEHYSSPKTFASKLDALVARIESQTIDIFERWLHDEPASAFLYLRDMTVGEVLALSQDKTVRAVLAKERVKYETFVAWVDMIPEMQAVAGTAPSRKFGALFVRWVLENERAATES